MTEKHSPAFADPGNVPTVFVNAVPGIDIDRNIVIVSLGTKRNALTAENTLFVEGVIGVRFAMPITEAEAFANALLQAVAMAQKERGEPAH